VSTSVREFENISEFLKSVDDAISEYRKRLGELLRKLEELRIRAEQEKKLKAILSKLGLSETTVANEVALRNVRIVVNPTAMQELAAMEAAVEALNNKVTLLTAVRKELEILSSIEVGAKLSVIYLDEVPRTIVLRLS
jgi:hypothetical protein